MAQRTLLIGLIALQCFSVAVLAQQSAPGAAISQRIDRIETALQVIRDYNDDFLSVILWALASIFGITALLVGASWYQSNRVLRREVSALRAELRSLIDASTSRIESPLRGKIEAAIQELQNSVKVSATEAAAAALSPLRGSLADLKNRILQIEYDAREEEVKRWMSEGVLANACRSAIEMATAGRASGDTYFVDRALDYLDKVFSGLEAASEKLASNDGNETQRFLERLPDAHKTARNALLSKLQKLQSL